jgi:flagellar hook protein FlgE
VPIRCPFDLNVSNITQFGSPFAVNDLTQDGFTPGHLAGISVSKDGNHSGSLRQRPDP